MMNTRLLPTIRLGAATGLAALVLGACSGSTEDVRVTFCKDLVRGLHPSTGEIEWKSNENTFRRPEYAITALTYERVDATGGGTAGRAACHYAYEALEDTAVNLANPLDAYETLPFAMTVDGRALSDAELLDAVNAEQRRRGRAVLDGLNEGARDLADKVRTGIGQ